MKPKINVLIGTKAEMIKIAPVLKEFDRRGTAYHLIETGQHGAYLSKLRKELEIREPDVRLGGFNDVDTLFEVFKWSCSLFLTLINRKRVKKVFSLPKGVCLLHGDTPSTFFGFLYAKRAGFQIAHLESGLRSRNFLHPFPEELIRVVVMKFSDVLFAPDITEYTTINIRSWYDDVTLPNCQDNIIENNSPICGIRTPTLLDSTRAETELWQDRRFLNSDVDLRINLLPPLEWTSLTSTESGYLTNETESSVNIFVGNEQINKDRVRNGIQVPHLIETWGQSSSAYLGIVNGIPNPQNHMTSRGVIRSFGAFAHELGHSLGLNHAVNQSSEAATFEAGTYNYGYYDSVNNIGTPLSYDGISCFIYSNPDKLCPTQAERDTRELVDLFDPSGTDLDKWLDGTWGSIPAGTSQADSSRFLQENLIYYERIIPNTNYGVTVGTEYVSTMSLLPQFNGASASYSYTENLPGLTTPDSLTMYSTVSDNETENSTTYSTLTWCSVQNCDIIYGNIFAWEGKTGYNARVGYQFYFNQGNLYLKRAKPIYEFATNSQGNHINYPTPCLQVNKYMKIGDYIETDCTSRREDIFSGAVDKTNWNFTNVVDKELVVTPYGTYDAYKIITSHSKWEFPSGRIINAQFDHNKLIFWVAPDVGIVMFEDEQHRRWKLTAMDSDGDGTDNKTDTDDDNDGVLDTDDALPLDPNSSTDDNNDGRADEDE